MSWTVEEDASIMISPKEHPRSVRIVGTFTRNAWHSSLVFNGRSEFDIHIRASIPSLDLLPFCGFIRAIVVVHASPKLFPLIISSSFCLLAEMVTSARMASMPSETRRNLEAMIGQYKIVHGVGTAESSTYIPEIFCGIILRISARKLSDIASHSLSISNLFSKYLFMSSVFGLMGITTPVVKYLVISPLT